MNFDVKFKSIKHSPSLVEYVQERFSSLSKYEIRPSTVHITFSEEGYNCRADIYINGYNGSFRAKGLSDSYFVSLDMCIKKLKRQMEKEKSKIKHHHHYDHSDEAQLEALAMQEDRSRKSA
ncbi:MAG: ribosome-associated translation inhibitor RaiA [Bdellovibrionales bacterium]|nr:ribosome-associated translation inhibitor RaiA [Bdellovibrionales bacterium]